MAKKILESSALSVFCESIAMMLSAGIQTDEAVYLLAENMEDSDFKRACDEVYQGLVSQKTFTEAIRDSQAFPQHIVDMIAAGEYSGRLEAVLTSLAQYYDEEDRLFTKIKSAIAYPAALLAIMSVVLLFTVSAILPVFINVYESLSGSITTGSYSFVNVSLVIGWVALGVTLLCALIVIYGILLTRSQAGRLRMMKFFQTFPPTKKPMRQMALARFTSALATYIASGLDTETSMKYALEKVDHVPLRNLIKTAQEEMVDTAQMKSLAQAIYDNKVYEPVYARMLVVGTRSGSIESVLTYLADTFMEDSVNQIDSLIDSIEPTLAAFLTISVGATLIAVMLPLIGIMGSIG